MNLDRSSHVPKITYHQAQRRYFWTFLPVMVFYTVFCFVGPELLKGSGQPPTWALGSVAIVTGAPIAVVFWLIARLLRETDEYTRKIQVDAILSGGAITLSAAVLWGFLELFEVVPRVPRFPSMMMVGPIFFGMWGLSYAYQHWRRT
jgi:hypothetical protein